MQPVENRTLILAPWGSNLGEHFAAHGLSDDVEVLHCQKNEWPSAISEEIRRTFKLVVVVIIMDADQFEHLRTHQRAVAQELAAFKAVFNVAVYCAPIRNAMVVQAVVDASVEIQSLITMGNVTNWICN